MTGSFTLSAWVNLKNYNKFSDFIGKSDNTQTNNAYTLRTNSTTGIPDMIVFTGASCTGTNIVGSTALGTNAWHLVTGVYNASIGTGYLYIDGILTSTQAGITGTVCGTNGNVQIGIMGAGGYGSGTNGSIDEARIYNRALSPSDVQNLYNYAPGPVAYYNFEEGSGSTVNDKSGYGNNGTWEGTLGKQYKTGKYGWAGNFNGTDNGVFMGVNKLATASGGLSFGAWAKWKSFPTSNVPAVLSDADSGAINGFMLYSGTSAPYNTAKAFVHTSNGLNVVQSSTLLNTNQWYYIYVTYDGTNLKLYLNGVLDTTQSATGTITSGRPGWFPYRTDLLLWSSTF